MTSISISAICDISCSEYTIKLKCETTGKSISGYLFCILDVGKLMKGIHS